jgi:hypothetical protein
MRLRVLQGEYTPPVKNVQVAEKNRFPPAAAVLTREREAAISGRCHR